MQQRGRPVGRYILTIITVTILHKYDEPSLTVTRIFALEGQLQRFYKFMSYERALKMLKNDTCIIDIGQAVLEL